MKDQIKTLTYPDTLPLMRLGLAHLPKDMLLQFVLYLEGLFNLKIRRNKDAAILFFTQSLTSTVTTNNELCRRTLLRLHELIDDKVTRLNFKNSSGEIL